MTDRERILAQIEAAKEQVRLAQEAYSKGGPVSAVNAANRKLADAHDRQYEWASGR